MPFQGDQLPPLTSNWKTDIQGKPQVEGVAVQTRASALESEERPTMENAILHLRSDVPVLLEPLWADL